jgi:hypothetical protein
VVNPHTDPIVVAYVLDRQDVRQIVSRVPVPVRNRRLALALTLVCVVTGIVALQDFRTLAMFAFAVAACGVFTVVCLPWLVRLLATVMATRQFSGAEVAASIAEDGVSIRRGTAARTYSWGEFEKVVDMGPGYAFSSTNTRTPELWIPKRAFTQAEDEDRFRAITRDRLGASP